MRSPNMMLLKLGNNLFWFVWTKIGYEYGKCHVVGNYKLYLGGLDNDHSMLFVHFGNNVIYSILTSMK